MFVFSTARTEPSVGLGQDIWKSSHESTDVCLDAVSANTGLYVPHDTSTYSTARSLSECCEDRCVSLSHNVCLSSSEIPASINSTSVCLSSMISAKHSQKQKLPVALMAARQSSLMLGKITLQSPCETCAAHLVSNKRVPEMHTTLPSSTVTVSYHSVGCIYSLINLINCMSSAMHCTHYKIVCKTCTLFLKNHRLPYCFTA